MRLRSSVHALSAFMVAGFVGLATSGCSTKTQQSDTAPVAAPQNPGGMQTFAESQTNSAEAMKAPYVVLVSIDGYRHDYNAIHKPTHLNKLAKEGVSAASLQPPYPSKTFPSHYSIATGLTPDRHGIVSNEFYDPARDAVYQLKNREVVEDGTWYGGEPLWVRAHNEGMLAASYFFVGSEADIGGVRPNYYYRYDESKSNAERVDQVLEWLKYPAETRPHLITMYFSDVDSAGHKFGPLSKETKEAVMKVDEQIGRLREGLKNSGLPVNLIVVSDHGMEALDEKKVIAIDQDPTVHNLLTKFRIFGRGPNMSLHLNKDEDRETIRALEVVLEKKAKHFRVRNREELKALHFSASDRVGDLVIEADPPYMVGLSSALPPATGGNHGWDPKLSKNMHGVFVAEGPAFRSKVRIPTIEGMDVYPLVLDILGLGIPQDIDGQLKDTSKARVAKSTPIGTKVKTESKTNAKPSDKTKAKAN